jgi:ABC-type nitrate/sulfonate/bicarbonate transport system permease component
MMAKSNNRIQDRFLAVLFALALLGLWQWMASQRIISPLFFPAPGRTLEALWNQIQDGRVWEPLAATVGRMFWGWLVASLVGIVIGALVASSHLLSHLLQPLLEFLRPLPASAVIPVAILAFGLSPLMAISVITFGSVWPVLLASVQGFSSVDTRLREVGAVLCMGPIARFWKISLPSALPGILAGARVGLAVALILAVVTEMQASLPGVGQNILMAQRSFKTPELYAGVILLGLVGFVASTLLQQAEDRVLRWKQAN